MLLFLCFWWSASRRDTTLDQVFSPDHLASIQTWQPDQNFWTPAMSRPHFSSPECTRLPREEAHMAALIYKHNYPFYFNSRFGAFCTHYGFLARKLQMVFEILTSLHRKKSLGPKAECWYLLPKFVFGFSIVSYIVPSEKWHLKNILSKCKSYIFIRFLNGGYSHMSLYKITMTVTPYSSCYFTQVNLNKTGGRSGGYTPCTQNLLAFNYLISKYF